MFECEYCGSKLTRRSNLVNHQKYTSYCVKIQKGKQRLINNKSYRCKICDRLYYSKSGFYKHSQVCSRKERFQKTSANDVSNLTKNINNIHNTNTIVNGNNINNINNNISVQFNNYTINNLTYDLIVNTLTPLITKAVIEAGMYAITEVIISSLLQKDGKYIYYCTDRSRKKFKMLIDQNGEVIEKADPDAYLLRCMLYGPLRQIVLPLITTENSVEDNVNNLNTSNSSTFQNDLSTLLPNSVEGVHPVILQNILDSYKKSAEFDKVYEDIKRNRLERKEFERSQIIDEFMNNCHIVNGLVHFGKSVYVNKCNGLACILDNNNMKIIGTYTDGVVKTDRLYSRNIEYIKSNKLEMYVDGGLL